MVVNGSSLAEKRSSHTRSKEHRQKKKKFGKENTTMSTTLLEDFSKYEEVHREQIEFKSQVYMRRGTKTVQRFWYIPIGRSHVSRINPTTPLLILKNMVWCSSHFRLVPDETIA